MKEPLFEREVDVDVCVMVVVVRSPWKGETEGGDRMGLMGGSRALPGGHHTPGLCHIPKKLGSPVRLGGGCSVNRAVLY